MKHLKIFLFFLFGIIAFTACDDDDEIREIIENEDEKEETEDVVYPTSPNPEWKIENADQYPMSMSAVVSISDSIGADATDNDKLAAFIGDECRGIGELVNINEKKIFFVLIKGNGSEQQNVKFRYYSIKNSYMYATNDFLKFEIDTRFGSVDQPEILPLKIEGI